MGMLQIIRLGLIFTTRNGTVVSVSEEPALRVRSNVLDSDMELEDEWQRGKEVGGHAIDNDEHDFRQMSPEVSVPFRRQLMLTFIEGFDQND